MRADAIIFDKDGTLLDFDAFWVTVSVKALQDVLASLNEDPALLEDILAALGVQNGVTDIDGILCRGTYRQMGEAVYDILHRHGSAADCETVTSSVIAAYERHSASGEVKPTCPILPALLQELKKRGKKLAVVTTDNQKITTECLEKLGIKSFFDRIYTDSGDSPTKPHPFCALDFCRAMGVLPEHTVMVGDTMTDIRFAQNAGLTSVILTRTEKAKATFAPLADHTVTSLSELLDMID